MYGRKFPSKKLRLLQGKLKTQAQNGFYYDTTDSQLCKALVGNMAYDTVVTFNTYEPLSEEFTATLIGLFEKRLNERLNCKLEWAHFYEITNGNAHSHSFVEYKKYGIQKQQFNRAARNIWAKLTQKQLAQHKARYGRDTAKIWIDEKRERSQPAEGYGTKGGKLLQTF